MNQELPLVIEKENLDTHKQDELAHWHNSFELIEVVIKVTSVLSTVVDCITSTQKSTMHPCVERKLSFSIQIILLKIKIFMRNIYFHYSRRMPLRISNSISRKELAWILIHS